MIIIIDFIGLIGFCLLVFGIYLILPAMAAIVGGTILMVFAFFAGRKNDI